MHTQLLSGTRGLIFGLSLHLFPYLVQAIREGSGKTAWMFRLNLLYWSMRSVSNSFSASDYKCLSPLQTVKTQIRPEKMLGLIWIQTVWTLMVFLKEVFESVHFEKKSADNKKSMQNYGACKKIILCAGSNIVPTPCSRSYVTTYHANI